MSVAQNGLKTPDSYTATSVRVQIYNPNFHKADAWEDFKATLELETSLSYRHCHKAKNKKKEESIYWGQDGK